MKHALLRWALTIFIGIPTQILVYLLYPIAIYLFRKKWKNKWGVKLDIPQEPIRNIQDIIDNGNLDGMRDEVYLDHDDTHNALLHMGIWSYKPSFVAKEGLRRMVRPDGGLKRRHQEDQDLPVSRDCLVAWIYSYSLYGGPKEELKKVLKHYLKYAFGFVHFTNGLVSTRSSAGGVNYTYDGYKKLSQPAFGPAFYNSSALFALAAKELGGIWRLVYWAHWLVYGGWLWWVEPFIYNNKQLIYYDQHITALSLATIIHNRKSKLAEKALRRLVVDISPSGNIDAFFYAIAWNAGVLDEKERQNAVKVTTNLSQFWPQIPPLDQSYFSGRNKPERYSMLGFHAKLLMSPKLKTFK